jgi:glycosyltransferase involved in cell wall biosynthesis
MKILILTENYHCGGMDTFLINLINNWPGQDDFVLVCNYDHPGLERIKKQVKRNCAIIKHYCITRPQLERRFADSPLAKALIETAMVLTQYILFSFYWVYFYIFIRKARADKVIICNGGYPAGDTCRAAALSGLFLAKSQKPLFIYHSRPMPPRLLKYFPESLIDWLLTKSISFLVTVSDYAQKQLTYNRPILARFRDKKVIYNGVTMDTANYSNASLRKELKIQANAPIILMLGTYEELKGHDFLLRSFLKLKEQIDNVFLIMAGFGYSGEQGRIRSLIERYKLQSDVILLGFRNDVPSLLRETQVLVVPSQTHESFGLAIIEAMSLGVPVVATDTGGIPEVIQNDRGGFVVSAADAGRFAEKITLILKDNNLQKAMGEEGRRVYQQRFLPQIMSKQYFGLINQ